MVFCVRLDNITEVSQITSRFIDIVKVFFRFFSYFILIFIFFFVEYSDSLRACNDHFIPFLFTLLLIQYRDKHRELQTMKKSYEAKVIYRDERKMR